MSANYDIKIIPILRIYSQAGKQKFRRCWRSPMLIYKDVRGIKLKGSTLRSI